MNLKEISVQTIAEPAKIKIEKNSKGYNYEISLTGHSLSEVWEEIKIAHVKLEDYVKTV